MEPGGDIFSLIYSQPREKRPNALFPRNKSETFMIDIEALPTKFNFASPPP